jgi:hypothetical protein
VSGSPYGSSSTARTCARSPTGCSARSASQSPLSGSSQAARGGAFAEHPSRTHDLALQRQVLDAFFAASRNGDVDALVTGPVPMTVPGLLTVPC